MPVREDTYECRPLSDPAAAKRLQGEAYVRHGHLPASELTSEGWLPWHDEIPAERVHWFGSFDAAGMLVAVGRRMVTDSTGSLSLPAARLMAAPPAGDGVVELSGVAKAADAPGVATLHLFRALYRESLRCGDRLWVMSVVPSLRATLERIAPGGITIGPDPVRMSGVYPGVRADVLAYPAWGVVGTFTASIRAAGVPEIADFMEAR
ncbi:hypothetical protein BJ973_002397 [Actinoplanes tereljensis]|uniref:Uncharacterized protein n=1 Tax=Paractinoplanes tereljensis TaxID=571912 RepID=A0A919TV68_9ACTN|nr:hypothetical protein [Actinoplanes tereljensis]GIF22070.1 hypothetical protein Ate02nite_48000 [Actinoplanes tereljensis]